MKYTFKDSYIYGLLGLDKVTQEISNKVNPNLEKYMLNDEHTAAIYSDIKSKIQGIGKEKILRLLSEKKIILTSVPGVPLTAWCIMDPSGKDIVVVCNLFSKIRESKDKKNISYVIKEVFGLVVVADVVRNFFKNENKFLYNSSLVSKTGVVYSRMLMRVIDSMFSINSIGNERESQFIEYMITKFYLRRVVEKNLDPKQESSLIASIMASSKKNSTIMYSVVQHDSRSQEFPNETFESIDTFCKEMANRVSGLNRLETNIMLRKLIMLLGEKAALMLESPQFLFAYLTSSAYNTNLIKDFQISSIAGPILGTIASEVIMIDSKN